MPTTRSNVPAPPEAEDLVFRHRTLVSARRILDAELRLTARPLQRDDLYVQRLRRLRIYLRNSIADLERRMQALGVAIMVDDEMSPPEPAALSHRRTRDYTPPASPE